MRTKSYIKLKYVLLVIFALFISIVFFIVFSKKSNNSYKEEVNKSYVKRSGIEIVNTHEHIESIDEVSKYLAAAKQNNISKTILVGSSDITIYLDPYRGFTNYEKNNEEILKIKDRYPSEFLAFVTIYPLHSNSLSMLKSYVGKGARGLKLYLGHGQHFNKGEKMGKEVFHEIPLDDKRMDPIYEYCEKNNIPIIYHVNCGKSKYLGEFKNVLDKYPDLKVSVPHFMLTLRNLKKLDYMFTTYSNLYTDISFGYHEFVVDGLSRITKKRDAVKTLVLKFKDRILFGTDIVVTKSGKTKRSEWIDRLTKCYIDMLEQDEYKCFLKPDVTLKGLHLDMDTLKRIYYTNGLNFINLQ